MLKRLELDMLNAELSSINYLLKSRSEQSDPIGYMQFRYKKEELENKISEISDKDYFRAEVGLFFGGEPVFGSKGIDARFASSIIETFQNIITKRFVFLNNGQLSSRGPIPNSNNTKLLITDVARGSFGFILEESPLNEECIIDSGLKHVVEDVNNIIDKFTSTERIIFEEVFDDIDDRILIDIRNFFSELYSSKATLKIIDSTNEFLLDKKKVGIAKERVDVVKISEERPYEVSGELFILPQNKKFEISISTTSERIIGSVSNKFLESYKQDVSNVVGKFWKIKLTARDIFENSNLVRTKYVLDDIIE